MNSLSARRLGRPLLCSRIQENRWPRKVARKNFISSERANYARAVRRRAGSAGESGSKLVFESCADNRALARRRRQRAVRNNKEQQFGSRLEERYRMKINEILLTTMTAGTHTHTLVCPAIKSPCSEAAQMQAPPPSRTFHLASACDNCAISSCAAAAVSCAISSS
jgi:hypothetical protein